MFVDSALRPFTHVLSRIRREVTQKMRNLLQKITKRTKVRFCRTYKSLRSLRFLLLGTNPLKQDFAACVFFCPICSGQNHPGDAVFENRLMKIDQQSDRNIQQFHVAEELRLAGWMQKYPNELFFASSLELSAVPTHAAGIARRSIQSIRFLCGGALLSPLRLARG